MIDFAGQGRASFSRRNHYWARKVSSQVVLRVRPQEGASYCSNCHRSCVLVSVACTGRGKMNQIVIDHLGSAPGRKRT